MIKDDRSMRSGGRSRIRIGCLRTLEHLALDLASLRLSPKGDTGCLLEPVCLSGWDRLFDLLEEGAIDGALIPPPRLFYMADQGADLEILMAFPRVPSLLVVGRPESVLKRRDFAGRTVFIPHDCSMEAVLLHRLMESAGLKPGPFGQETATVVWEAAPPCLMPEILALDDEKEIGGFFVPQPYASLAQACGGGVFLRSTDLWPDHPGSLLVMRRSAAIRESSGTDAVVQACQEAVQDLGLNPQSALKSASSFLSIDTGLAARLLKTIADTCRNWDPAVDLKSLETVGQYLMEAMGAITGPVDVSRLIEGRHADGMASGRQDAHVL